MFLLLTLSMCLCASMNNTTIELLWQVSQLDKCLFQVSCITASVDIALLTLDIIVDFEQMSDCRVVI